MDFLEKWHTEGKAKYVVGQLEKGEEGTRHIQYFLNFKEPVRMSALKKHCPRTHWEEVKINNGAHDYCMKEETRLDGPWEFGEKPVQRNNKTDWEEVKTKAINGNLEAIPADIFVKHYGQLKQIAKDHQKIEPRTEPKKCLWYYGSPGTGKTRKATQEHPDIYKKLQNKWWDAYQGQKEVLIDDLGAETGKALTTHLKLWLDPWQNHPGETKGGQVAHKYDLMIITSNYHPAEIWNGVDLEAILRRVTLIKFNDGEAQE